MKDKAQGGELRNPQLPAQKDGAKKKMRIRRLDKIETTALCGDVST